MIQTTKAVATTDAKRDIRSLIQSDAVKLQMAMALPKHLTADRMARVALTTIMRVPKLAQCTPESLLNCLMQCSQLGLEPDGRRAHLIPFENRKTNTTECTLIVDWKGLAELAMRSGCVAKLHADVICDKDEFAYDLGEVLHHRIDFRKPRGEPYAAYSMAVTKTGEKFVQVMTRDEIEGIRDNSQGWRAFKAGYAKQSPWQDSPGEMWKKTVFRRLSKWLPLSAEYRDALDVDDEPLPATVTDSMPQIAQDIPKFISGPAAEPEAETPPTAAAKRKKPEPAPEAKAVDNPGDVLQQVIEGDKSDPLLPLTMAMGVAEVTPEQLLTFYNKNKGTELKSLSEIPEDSRPKLIALLANPDSEQVKGMKT